MQKIELAGGTAIPVLGLGVYQARAGSETRDAVREALQLGYRHVDTASVYGNEREVGEAVRASGLPREDVWITTKLWNSDQGYEKALAAFETSRKRLGVEQVDLYLIHWPSPPRVDSWRALLKLKADGRCRAIGVSNFTVPHLEQLIERTGTAPEVNQVELSPFLQQRELMAYCREKRIVVEAYSPLTRGEKLQDPALGAIAHRRGKTRAQVLLRWVVEQGHVLLPKSVHPERIAENAAIFDWELTDEDRRELDQLDIGFRTCWDPTGMP